MTGTPTSDALRAQWTEKLRLAAFSGAQTAPLFGLPAALRGLFSAPLSTTSVTGRSAKDIAVPHCEVPS